MTIIVNKHRNTKFFQLKGLLWISNMLKLFFPRNVFINYEVSPCISFEQRTSWSWVPVDWSVQSESPALAWEFAVSGESKKNGSFSNGHKRLVLQKTVLETTANRGAGEHLQASIYIWTRKPAHDNVWQLTHSWINQERKKALLKPPLWWQCTEHTRPASSILLENTGEGKVCC